MKWDRSPFSLDIRTFWYIFSKNANRFYIFFTDWSVGGLLFWIFVKLYWNIRIKQTSVLFCKYLRNGSSAIQEILCGGELLSSELRFQISWRFELWLRRYLQNITGICLIINFQCIFHISQLTHLWSLKKCRKAE